MAHMIKCSVCKMDVSSRRIHFHFKKVHPEHLPQDKKTSLPTPTKHGGDFINYATYIKSSEWKSKSTLAKQRAGYRCQICNRSSNEITLHVHHRTYERLGHEENMDLTVLCKDCHLLFESMSGYRPAEQ